MIPRGTCAPSPGRRDRIRIRALASRVARDLEKASPGALHVLSLLALQWSDGAGRALNDAIANLQSAAKLASRPDPVLADLSAAYLLRAQWTQNALDLFRAAEAAADALATNPENQIAHFNLALALSWLGLRDQALDAWSAYLRVDSVTAWAADARRTSDSLTVLTVPLLPRYETPEAWADFAADAPQEARLAALNTVLWDWGEATLRGDARAAADRLHIAEVTGAALERRGGDVTVADAVRAIRAHAGQSAVVRAIARAHVEYAHGQVALDDKRYREALASFERALAPAAASPSLQAWTEYFRGVALFFNGRGAAAMQVFDAMAPRTDTLRQPALAGRLRWSRGTILLRAGRYLEALSETRAAIRYFGRIGEREHLGAMQSQASEAEFALGDEAAAYASMHAALLALRPYRRSVRLHNHLYVITQAATASGFVRVAVRIQDEGVAAAERIDPRLHAEALLARARARTAAGDVDQAVADVNAGAALVRKLAPGYERSWYEEDLRLTQAGVMVRTHPAAAIAALDRVVEFFSGDHNALRGLPALVRRGEAWLALGHADRAAADLDVATMLLDSLGAGVQDAALRASMLEAARGPFDRLVMLLVAAGQPRDALAALERGRGSASTPGRRSSTPPVRLVAPPGEIVLDYALIADTLLIWTVSGDSVHLERRTIDSKALLRTIESTRLALELRASADAVRAGLTALFAWLVGPVQHRIAPETPLVLVADGEVLAVPFAALYEERRRRYLIEDHLLRFATTLSDANRPSHRPPALENGTALFVADPAFDAREYPELQPLGRAADEVHTIAAWYRRPTVLTRARANFAEVQAALGDAEVFHFAGHGVFDDERPARSYLLLSGSGESGRLTAAELGRMQFAHVRLVVLAACETQRSRGGRTGGLSGLSGAILGAGAHGVIGSLWRVDDELTRTLMIQLHHAYRQNGDGAVALQAAQIRLLRSEELSLQSPAAWAGFRYVGS
jgi:CHAT domain-containing protein/tetratricopeptide (TPR) repeat protein